MEKNATDFPYFFEREGGFCRSKTSQTDWLEKMNIPFDGLISCRLSSLSVVKQAHVKLFNCL